MASPKPPAPDEVPETAATYERTDVDTTLKRADAKDATGGAAKSESKSDLPPPEHQQPSAIRQQKQTGRQQQHQAAQSDDARPAPLPAGGKIAGNMKTEEPEGWDQAPMDIKDPRQQRHPRPDGVGGSEPDSAKRDPER